MSWDSTYEASPTEGDLVGGGNEAMQGIKTDVRTRIAKEHQFDLTEAGGQPLQGLHRQGSAKAYYVSSNPTTRPDGVTALTSDDAGRLMVDSSTLEPKVYSGSAWTKLKVTLASILALGTNWSVALAATLGSGWTTALASTLGTNWATPLADNYVGPVAGTGLFGIPGCTVWNASSLPGHADVAYSTSTSYSTSIKFRCPVTGTVSMKFRIASFSAGTLVYGRIYKNTAAFGTERSTSSGIYTTFSEDLAVSRGDTIELYIKTADAGVPVVVSGFALCSGGYGQICF